MARPTVFALIAAVLLAACGEEQRAAPPVPTATAEATATSRATAAGSAQECFELWNEHEALGTAGQTAPADVLADLAPTDDSWSS
jgi:hypothetical protein